MIEPLFAYLNHGLALYYVQGSGALALLARDGGYGPWSTILGILKGLVIAAGGVGVVGGLAVKAVGAGNSDRQEFGNRMLEVAIAGLLIGLLAPAIYDLIVGWTS